MLCLVGKMIGLCEFIALIMDKGEGFRNNGFLNLEFFHKLILSCSRFERSCSLKKCSILGFRNMFLTCPSGDFAPLYLTGKNVIGRELRSISWLSKPSFYPQWAYFLDSISGSRYPLQPSPRAENIQEYNEPPRGLPIPVVLLHQLGNSFENHQWLGRVLRSQGLIHSLILIGHSPLCP